MMIKAIDTRERLSIDVSPQEHRRIKACAALAGQSIREYVLKNLQEQLNRENEEKGLADLTGHLENDIVLKELWDNKKDSAYDSL